MIRDFVAIDFETANRMRSSVCSIGLVFVKNGIIVDEQYSLIKPYPNYYLADNTAIHGLTPADTNNAPTFDEVWERFEPMVRDLPFVAHNAPFDRSCLIAAHNAYDLYYPYYTFFCTLKASRHKLRGQLPNHQLHTVAAYCGYDLTAHHNALADAEACAHIALKLL